MSFSSAGFANAILQSIIKIDRRGRGFATISVSDQSAL
jgi:hypothetical protein